MSQGLIRIGALPYSNPDWCNWPGATQFVSFFGSNVCTPKTDAQIRSEQVKDLEHVCRNAADPKACVTAALIKSDADVEAATRSEAEHFGTTPAIIECEQRAAAENPTLSSIFGPGLVCGVKELGIPGHTFMWAGAALLLYIVIKKKS